MKGRDQDLGKKRTPLSGSMAEAYREINRRMRERRRQGEEGRSVFDRLADNPGYQSVRIDVRELP